MKSEYSRLRLSEYLDKIGIPTDHIVEPTYQFLEKLHVYQISTIPYENLSLHYSTTKSNSLDSDNLFRKIVSPQNRGGYCFELAIFFKHILLAIGFHVYTAAATIRLRKGVIPQGDFAGYMHVVNIVTIDGQKFMVDVSFGGDGPTRPLPLQHDKPQRNLGGQDVRLVKRPIETGGEEFWIYQYRNNESEWNSYYAFQEKESNEEEIGRRNEKVSLDPGSFQRKMILAVKFLRHETEIEIVGKVMMIDDMVKLNMGGRTEVVEVCNTEERRVEALKKWFGLTLTQEEIDGIRGHGTEIT